jgi:hypothetical protein
MIKMRFVKKRTIIVVVILSVFMATSTEFRFLPNTAIHVIEMDRTITIMTPTTAERTGYCLIFCANFRLPHEVIVVDDCASIRGNT